MPTIRSFVPAALLAAVACGGADAKSASLSTTTDSAGIAIVAGPAVDTPLPWTLTETRRIGGADTGAASFTRASQYNVTSDGVRRIAVLDGDGGNKVHIFDSTGAVLASFGGKGEGPGELQWPGSVSFGADGGYMIYDGGKQSLVQWDATGAFTKQTRFEFGNTMPWGKLQVSGDSMIAMFRVGDTVRTVFRLQMLTPRDTTTIDSLPVGSPKPVMFTCVGMAMEPLFSSALSWTYQGGTLASTRQTDYQVALREGGVLRRIVRRAIVPVAAKPADAKRLYPEGMTVKFGNGGGCTTPAEEVAEKAGMAKTIPLVRGLALAPDGTLWVERFTFQGETPMVDVFDKGGNYLGTLTGKGMPLGFLGPDTVLFSIDDDATGGSVVGIYRIDRSPGNVKP